MLTNYESFMHMCGSWMVEKKQMEYEDVYFIYKFLFGFLEVRIHFVLEYGCTGCCGRSTMSVFPFDAPCGPERVLNEKNEEVISTAIMQVGRGDKVYCQTNRNLEVACHDGWVTIEIHNALADCKEAGPQDGEIEYDEPIMWSWDALCQHLE